MQPTGICPLPGSEARLLNLAEGSSSEEQPGVAHHEANLGRPGKVHMARGSGLQEAPSLFSLLGLHCP